MKQITNITPEGVHYLDEDGNLQFIDFVTCQQNNIENMKESMGARWTKEEEIFYQKAKFVGLRVTFRQPPALEFYTEPRIYFEFPTRDDVWEIVSMIKKAGWRTNDGE